MKSMVLSVVGFLSGCSAYPLPDDLMGYSSFDIATQVRCDARYAIQDLWIGTILSDKKQKVTYGKMSGNEYLNWLNQDRSRYHELDLDQIRPDISRDAAKFYRSTLMSFDFSLDGTEQNEGGFSATVLGQFTKHTDTIGLDVGRTATRQGKRQFRLFDTFESLGLQTRDEICRNFKRLNPLSELPNKSYKSRPDLLFPSTGALRMHNMVRDFLALNNSSNLGGTGSDWRTASLTDTIVFTTKSQGDLSPKTEVLSNGTGWSFSKIGFSSKNYRQDIHQIILNISLPSDGKTTPLTNENGKLTLSSARSAVEVGARNLDEAKSDNFRDSVRDLSIDLRNN